MVMLRKIVFLICLCCFILHATAEDSIPVLTDSATVATDSSTVKPIATVADSVVALAQTYLGAHYHYGANGSNGSFDCSGFVAHLFAQCGIALPHSSRAQYTLGLPVAPDSIQPGDLVFFQARRSANVGHVGIVVEPDTSGNGWRFIHASTHGGVCISHSSEPYYKRRFIGIKRL